MAPVSKAPDIPHHTRFAAGFLRRLILPGNLTFQCAEALGASTRIKLRAGA
jgi:hypothetical protein